MRTLLHKHYKKKKSICKHCRILYEKHNHLIYVSLGSLDSQSDFSRYEQIGINVAIHPEDTGKEAFFNLHIPLVAVTY